MKKRFFDIIHQNPFYISDDKNLSEQAFRLRMASSIVSIIACLVVMVSSAFALFRSEVSTDNSRLLGAYYFVSVEGADENGTYICHSAAEDKHTFEIKAGGTATTGYCKIQVGDDVYYTEQIKSGSSFFITVQAVEGTVITFTPQWGPMHNNSVTDGYEIFHSSTPVSKVTEQGYAGEKTGVLFEETENTQSENSIDITGEERSNEAEYSSDEKETLLSDLDETQANPEETEPSDSETEMSISGEALQERGDNPPDEGSLSEPDENTVSSDAIESIEPEIADETESSLEEVAQEATEPPSDITDNSNESVE